MSDSFAVTVVFAGPDGVPRGEFLEEVSGPQDQALASAIHQVQLVRPGVAIRAEDCLLMSMDRWRALVRDAHPPLCREVNDFGPADR